MKPSKLTAVSLRAFLATMIVLIIILAGVGFYFTQDWLRSYSRTVGQAVADSISTGNDIQNLQKLQKELEERQDTIVKASSLITSTQTYQSQAIQDLKTYASLSGVAISNFTFTPVTATPTTGAAASTAATSGVTVTLTSPVGYTSLLKFLTLIEGNIPKMQVSSMSLGRISGSSDSVKIDTITIEVSAL